MQVMLPPWPAALDRQFTRRVGVRGMTPLRGPRYFDLLAERNARRLRDRENVIQNGGGTWSECLFQSRADYNAFNSSAAEGSLLAGVNQQPVIPALYFDGLKGFGRSISLLARGVMGTTGTPTLIFQVRLGTTAGASTLTGSSVGVSASITTASAVSNKWWELRLDLVCQTPGQGSGNTTLSGSGYVMSPGGFASPYVYPLEPTTPDTATWTQTLDSTATQYLNLSATWGTSSPSNTITCKKLQLIGWN
jgi:hypothetical protein